MKIILTNREIPRNKSGDPHFNDLSQLQGTFSSEEIVELCNRSLYQLEYQARSHQKYRTQREELERPVREVFKQLYPEQSFTKATDEQLKRCVEEMKKRS